MSELCIAFIRRDLPELRDDDALALSGHLNLGTGQHGSASAEAIEPEILDWVCDILEHHFRPKIVILVGLTTVLRKHPEYRDQLCKALTICWTRPDSEVTFDGYGCMYRLWRAGRRGMAVLAWPNHPSRVPFASRQIWTKSIEKAAEILRLQGF